MSTGVENSEIKTSQKKGHREFADDCITFKEYGGGTTMGGLSGTNEGSEKHSKSKCVWSTV